MLPDPSQQGCSEAPRCLPHMIPRAEQQHPHTWEHTQHTGLCSRAVGEIFTSCRDNLFLSHDTVCSVWLWCTVPSLQMNNPVSEQTTQWGHSVSRWNVTPAEERCWLYCQVWQRWWRWCHTNYIWHNIRLKNRTTLIGNMFLEAIYIQHVSI